MTNYLWQMPMAFAYGHRTFSGLIVSIRVISAAFFIQYQFRKIRKGIPFSCL